MNSKNIEVLKKVFKKNLTRTEMKITLSELDQNGNVGSGDSIQALKELIEELKVYSIKDLATEYGVGHNRLKEYLRTLGLLDSDNLPSPCNDLFITSNSKVFITSDGYDHIRTLLLKRFNQRTCNRLGGAK